MLSGWLLLLGALSPAEAAPAPLRAEAKVEGARAHPMALHALRNKRYRRAVQMLRPTHQAYPEAGGVQVLLGHALAGLHRCEEALPLLEPNLGRPAFTAEVARLVGSCYARQGAWAEALYWNEHAITLNPTEVTHFVDRASYLAQWGEEELAAELLGICELIWPDHPALLTHKTIDSLRRGAILETEENLNSFLEAKLRRYPLYGYLSAKWELDLGELRKAEEAAEWAFARLPGYLPAQALWVESLRRQGDLEGVEAALSAPTSILEEETRRKALGLVMVRIAVDKGELSEAAELLDWMGQWNSSSAEFVATRWYLARAQGRDAETLRALEEDYAKLESSALRSLESYVPHSLPS